METWQQRWNATHKQQRLKKALSEQRREVAAKESAMAKLEEEVSSLKEEAKRQRKRRAGEKKEWEAQRWCTGGDVRKCGAGSGDVLAAELPALAPLPAPPPAPHFSFYLRNGI